MKKDYVIFNQRLAGHLMMLGYVLKKIEKTTKDNSNRNVFYFNESEELLRSVKDFKDKK